MAQWLGRKFTNDIIDSAVKKSINLVIDKTLTKIIWCAILVQGAEELRRSSSPVDLPAVYSTSGLGTIF